MSKVTDNTFNINDLYIAKIKEDYKININGIYRVF